MAADGGEERVTHEVEIVLVCEHAAGHLAALGDRLHCVHVRDLKTEHDIKLPVLHLNMMIIPQRLTHAGLMI